MEEVYKSKYFTIWLDTNSNTVSYLFNEKTADMSKVEYIDELKEFIEIVRKYQAKRVFGEMVDFKFTITPDVQEWIDQNLFKVYREVNFEKIAIMLSKDFFSQLSIQQTMEDSAEAGFQTKYFDNKAEALAWLHK
jgi:hypothetical protein